MYNLCYHLHIWWVFLLNDVAMQNHWMFLELVKVTRQCKLRFFLELYQTKHTCIVLHEVLWVSSDEDHQRLVINFYLYLCFLWLLSLALKMAVFIVAWWWPNIIVWCFRWKAYLKSDTVVGLTTRLPLKRYKIHVCLRNFNYEICCFEFGALHFHWLLSNHPINGIAAQIGINKL